MTETVVAPRAHRGLRPTRSSTNQVVGGVAAGIAHDLHVDPFLSRTALLILSLARGAGLLIYLLLFVFGVERPTDADAVSSGPRQIAGIAALTAGILLLLEVAGWWSGDGFVWSVAVAGLGSMVVWARTSAEERSRFVRAADRHRAWNSPAAIVRLIIGFALVGLGAVSVLREYSSLSLVRIVVPIAVTIMGLVLALGPWLLRLSKQLREERRERIRSEERSAISAHLHDSVLQTLALIQRSGSQQQVTALARRQERELRAWLYGKRAVSKQTNFRVALEAAAARVEELTTIPIEVVIVGEAPMDARLDDLVQAAAEAMSNSARHSGAPQVTVYAEVEPGQISVYVRDEGDGFDTSAVRSDRRGIADSIVARMGRMGGTGEISSRVGSGTDVKLTLPRKR